ncbi:MAG: hypothetical protein ACKOBV_05085 [Candidatus Kapaibacterium sp.]
MKTMAVIVRLGAMVVVSALFLQSCGTTVWQLKASECSETNEETMRSITGVLLSKNFQIKSSDVKLGLLIAETEPKVIWTNSVEKRVWQFQIVNNTSPLGTTSMLTASAKTVTQMTNAFGAATSSSETYYNDDCAESWDWYWDVRNSVQKLCGKVVFTEKKTQ